jgi:rsbT co-antagonist protein RsbR
MSATADPFESELGATILEHVADVLMAVADIGLGDFSKRLETDLPREHPLATLYAGVNEMMESLANAQARSVAYEKELEEKLNTIELQRAAMQELATPIIEVWEGILCLPVVGVLDTTRSAAMTDLLLDSVVSKRATCAIIDITGIQVMDTATADHFLRMARAVRLVGADCLLTGVNPAIAQTMVHMGVDLHDVETHRSLQTALVRYIMRSLREDRTDRRHRSDRDDH